MKKQEQIRRFTGVLLLMLFVSYYSSVTLNVHSHIVDGTIITHSHLHSDSHHSTEDGGHTKQSVNFIAHLSDLEYTGSVVCEVPAPDKFCIDEGITGQNDCWINQIHLENLSLRAPPVL